MLLKTMYKPVIITEKNKVASPKAATRKILQH